LLKTTAAAGGPRVRCTAASRLPTVQLWLFLNTIYPSGEQTACKVTDGSFRNGRQCKAVLTDCELIVVVEVALRAQHPIPEDHRASHALVGTRSKGVLAGLDKKRQVFSPFSVQRFVRHCVDRGSPGQHQLSWPVRYEKGGEVQERSLP
jgi:hypothetical protein